MAVKIFHLILPAPILGLIIFSCLIQMNIIKKEWVKDICALLLKNMPVMFVTATLTLLLTAIITDNIIKYIRLRKMRKMKND